MKKFLITLLNIILFITIFIEFAYIKQLSEAPFTKNWYQWIIFFNIIGIIIVTIINKNTEFEIKQPKNKKYKLKDNFYKNIENKNIKNPYYTGYIKLKNEEEKYYKQLEENRIQQFEETFYNSQIKKLTKTEKEYYNILYKNFHNDFKLETQVYLRSMFPKMQAPNLLIDIVFKTKNTNKPILLIEINDETHNKRKLTILRDKDLKIFCQKNNIKLQSIWTRFGVNEKSIINLINNKLYE